MGVGADGAMTDISSYADLQAGVERSWGRRTGFDDIEPGVFSFTLDNSDGRFTPGNTSSPLATTVTEGMSVAWNLGGRIVAGTVLSIEPTFPSAESAWAQIRITCDDMLGAAGRRTLGTLIESITAGATPYLFWPLDDAVGTVVPRETITASTTLLRLTGTIGSVFGATAITGLEGATQLTLKDTLTVLPGNPWPTFDFTYGTGTLGFYSFWITPTSASSEIVCQVALTGLLRTIQFGYTSSAYFVRDGYSGTTDTYASTSTEPHFVSMGLTSVLSGTWTITATLYVDGVEQASIVYGDTVASLDYRAPLSISLAATS